MAELKIELCWNGGSESIVTNDKERCLEMICTLHLVVTRVGNPKI